MKLHQYPSPKYYYNYQFLPIPSVKIYITSTTKDGQWMNKTIQSYDPKLIQ